MSLLEKSLISADLRRLVSELIDHREMELVQRDDGEWLLCSAGLGTFLIMKDAIKCLEKPSYVPTTETALKNRSRH